MQNKKALVLKLVFLALTATMPLAHGAYYDFEDYSKGTDNENFGSDYEYGDYDYSSYGSYCFQKFNRTAISAEFFLGKGTDEWEDFEPTGLTVTLSQEFGPKTTRMPVVVPVGFIALRGGGDEIDDGISDETCLVGSADIGLRANFVLSEHITLYAGGRIGGGWASFEIKKYGRKVLDESFWGLSLGLGVGGEFTFNEHHAITFGFENWGIFFSSKSNNDFEIENMNTVLFSLGYKYNF